MSFYITIRANSSYSVSVETPKLVAFLITLPDLRQVGLTQFQARMGAPWVNVVFANANSSGSYTINNDDIKVANVVELICSDDGERTWYDSLACRIADFLGWSAFEDHEGRRIWPTLD